MIQRDKYLAQLVSSRGNGLIKIVTGIRRCGKSYLLFHIFHDYLLSHGVDRAHLIEVALDDLLNEPFHDPRQLLLHIREQIVDSGTYYVLLDEIQMVDNFVGVLNSLLHLDNVDVYVTGSNSRFLSSDIATEFRGRGDEIHLSPLSFAEFFSVHGGDKQSAWRDYISYGGLPQVLSLETAEKKVGYLRNLYSAVYIKDLVERNKIKKVADFDKLVKILSSAIGAPCNPNKLANTFKSVEKSDLNAETISFYLSYLQDAFMIEKSLRFDIKGKRYLGTLSKYYFVDMGLRNAIIDFRQIEETHIMENVIYNELRSRGYLVDVGMVEERGWKDGHATKRQLEVDFVANQGSRRYYVQSALAIPDAEKMAQETASLRRIADSFKKVVIVKDDVVPWHNEDGFLIINLFDFLLNPDSLEA